MMLITATKISEEEAATHEVTCELIDYATVFAAELSENASHKCELIPVWAVTLRPADDMLIPVFVCKVHFAALKMSLHEGVGVDEDVFGEFPED
jgi:hypothetical protein